MLQQSPCSPYPPPPVRDFLLFSASTKELKVRARGNTQRGRGVGGVAFTATDLTLLKRILRNAGDVRAKGRGLGATTCSGSVGKRRAFLPSEERERIG